MKKPTTASEKDTGPVYATWRARCRAYEAQGLIKLKPGSPATVQA